MSEPIVNKVADSGLITFDLTQFLIGQDIVLFDIKQYLFMELILKEKEFRANLLTTDWTVFQDKHVGIYCSIDAVIPMWANMLIASALEPYAKSIHFGNEDQVRADIILKGIHQINIEEYKDQRMVIKGCGETPVGESAYIAITHKLKPVVKSIMYGEPCSTVPVYKRKEP
jgi:hypothetical protein